MRVGCHVNRHDAGGPRLSIAGHIEAARREAEHEAGLELAAAQIFVGGPRNRQITLRAAEAAELKEYAARTGLFVLAHSSYTAVPWRGDPDAARYIREEARVCQAAGIAGLVVHLPKQPAADVVRYAARLLDPGAPGVRVYLETPAVTPRETYYETPGKLAALFRALRAGPDPGLARFGLCVDTAHLNVSGVDLRTYEAAAAWLAGLEAASDVIPHDRVVVHGNDSLRELGVGPDAHAALAQGKIWGEFRERLGASGLAAFVDYAQRHDTAFILERKPKELLVDDYLVLAELGAKGVPAPASGR
jgi:sugar phosphate isomerase/epimerase